MERVKRVVFLAAFYYLLVILLSAYGIGDLDLWDWHWMKSGECSGMSDLIGLFFSASLSARQGRKLQRVARQRVTMLQREAGLRQWQTWVATRHHTQFHTLRSVNWSCVTTRPYKNTSKFYVLTQLKEETWQLDNLYICLLCEGQHVCFSTFNSTTKIKYKACCSSNFWHQKIFAYYVSILWSNFWFLSPDTIYF